MFESIINTVVTTVIANPGSSPLSDAALYLNGATSSQSVTAVRVGSTSLWTVSFTPNATGLWTLFGFGTVQFRTKTVAKSLYDFLNNIEDESLGSWSWDKTAGTLTMLRQDGTLMATYDVVDGLETSSRERVS